MINTQDIIPISKARARLTELADDVSKTGHEKVFTKNGESYVAVVGVADLDEYQRLRAADHMRNLHDLVRAASEMEAGKAMPAAAFRKQAAALVMGVAPDKPAAAPKKAAKRQTR